MIRWKLFWKGLLLTMLFLVCAGLLLCAAGIFVKSAYFIHAGTGTDLLPAERWFATACVLAGTAFLWVTGYCCTEHEVFGESDETLSEMYLFALALSSPLFLGSSIWALATCFRMNHGVKGSGFSAGLLIWCSALFSVLYIYRARRQLADAKRRYIKKSLRKKELCRIVLLSRDANGRRYALARLQTLLSFENKGDGRDEKGYKIFTVRDVLTRALTDPDASVRKQALQSADEAALQNALFGDAAESCRACAASLVQDQAALKKAAHDPAPSVRAEVICRLRDQQTLEQAIFGDKDLKVCALAISRMRKLGYSFSDPAALQAYVDGITERLRAISTWQEFQKSTTAAADIQKLKVLYEGLCQSQAVRFHRVHVPIEHADEDEHWDDAGYYDVTHDDDIRFEEIKGTEPDLQKEE